MCSCNASRAPVPPATTFLAADLPLDPILETDTLYYQCSVDPARSLLPGGKPGVVSEVRIRALLVTERPENKDIQSGAVTKPYMRKGFLIYEEMRKYFPIYEQAASHI